MSGLQETTGTGGPGRNPGVGYTPASYQTAKETSAGDTRWWDPSVQSERIGKSIMKPRPRYEKLLAKYQQELPGVTIRRKATKSLLGRLIPNWPRMGTTIGRTIWMPASFDFYGDGQAVEMLRHEMVHVRQWRYCFTPRHPRVNAVLFALAYCFWLPFLWTWRSRFERQAYTVSLLSAWETIMCNNGEVECSGAQVIKFFGTAGATAHLLSGPTYLWAMTHGQADKWALDTALKIVHNEIKLDDRDKA